MRILTFLFVLLLSVPAWAQLAPPERQKVDDNNPYGGATYQYQNLDDGIFRQKTFFDSEGKLTKEEILYTDDFGVLSGLRSVLREYLFETLVIEEKVYAPRYVKIRWLKRSVDHFEQSTGKRTKTENFFAKPYMGNNVIHYHNGIKTKIEWIYPDNEEGFSGSVIHFDQNGIDEAKVESTYTPKSARLDGIEKIITYKEKSRITRIEWYYSESFGKKWGYRRKIQLFEYHPSIEIKPRVLYLDEEGTQIHPKKFPAPA